MRRVSGPHSSENIIGAIIPVLRAIGVVGQLGLFIGDNAPPNDTTIQTILCQLRPDIKDPDSRRVRCLGHIINRAAKAFLFGKDSDAFEEESQTKKQLIKLEAVRELWRKKGPLEKYTTLLVSSGRILRGVKPCLQRMGMKLRQRLNIKLPKKLVLARKEN